MGILSPIKLTVKSILQSERVPMRLQHLQYLLSLNTVICTALNVLHFMVFSSIQTEALTRNHCSEHFHSGFLGSGETIDR